MITIVELKNYIKRVVKFFNEDERNDIIAYLAYHPKAGDIMQGTGGVRKVRWAKDDRGKSGGVRIVYYYYDDNVPLFLITVFGKNEQANLSRAERNELAKLVQLLVEQYK